MEEPVNPGIGPEAGNPAPSARRVRVVALILLLVFCAALFRFLQEIYFLHHPLARYDFPAPEEVVDSVPPRIAPEVKPRLTPIDVKPDLSNIENLQEFAFSDAQKEFIARHHALIYDGGFSNMVCIYVPTPIPFVTSDLMLHVYHKMFSNILENLESVALEPNLERFLDGISRGLEGRRARSRGETAAAVDKARLVVLTALGMLGKRPPGDAVGRRADEIVRAVKSERGIDLHEFPTADLTRLKPRFGYGESLVNGGPMFNEEDRVPDSELPYVAESTARKFDDGEQGELFRSIRRGRYFSALQWLGQAGFELADREDRLALLAVAACLRDDSEARAAAASFAAAIEFLAGPQNGASLEELLGFARPHISATLDADTPDEAALAAFAASPWRRSRILDARQAEGVTSGTAPLRFHLVAGRSTTTGEVFQRIADGLGGLPSSLDYARIALDSDLAGRMAADRPVPDSALALKRELDGRPERDWYRSWSGGVEYSLRALVRPAREGSPAFTRTPLWEAKNLNSALGGWTHVNHDIAVYAAQTGIAGDGAGGFARFSGYVEPNPEFFSRLRHSVVLLKRFLGRCGHFDSKPIETYLKRKKKRDYRAAPSYAYTTEREFDLFERMLARLETMAGKELSGVPFDDAEHRFLLDISSPLRHLTFDWASNFHYNEDSSLVCDVANDYEKGICLQTAVGRPYNIVVVVPWGDKLYLAKGGVFSFREFTRPIGARMTDEAWRASGQTAEITVLQAAEMTQPALLEIHDPEVLAKNLHARNPNVRVATARRLLVLEAYSKLPAILGLLAEDAERVRPAEGDLHGHGTRFVSESVAGHLEDHFFRHYIRDEGERETTLKLRQARLAGAVVPLVESGRADSLEIALRVPRLSSLADPRIREAALRNADAPDPAVSAAAKRLLESLDRK